MQVRPVRSLDAQDADEGLSGYPSTVAERWTMHGLSGSSPGADAMITTRPFPVRTSKSKFYEEVQSMVDSGPSSLFVAVALPSMPFVIGPHAEASFAQRMEHLFTPSYLLVSREVAPDVRILDLKMDRWSIVCDLYARYGGQMPGSLFTNPAGPAHIEPRPGWWIELKVKNLTDRPLEGFEAALLGSVTL